KVLDAISAGYQLGIHAKKKLLSMKWEEMWERQLDELRASLDVVPLGVHGGALNVSFAPVSLCEKQH
ncbi:MAG: hypothetical protein AAFV28_08445, partial [Cyanobacteria bacterium J06635_13]